MSAWALRLLSEDGEQCAKLGDAEQPCSSFCARYELIASRAGGCAERKRIALCASHAARAAAQNGLQFPVTSPPLMPIAGLGIDS